jgi:polysaccharide pyruvyl transferase WcaK-like protein
VGVSPGIYAHVYSEKGILRHVFSYAKALDRAVDEFDLNVIFVPHYISGFDYDDLRISEMIIQNMKNSSRARIVKMESVDDFILLLYRMDMMISAKMHPAVLALSRKIPTVCVAYDHKQTGLFKSINMTECVVPISEFSDTALFSKVSYVWRNRASIRNQLCVRIPLVQNNVKRAVDFALETCLRSA